MDIITFKLKNAIVLILIFVMFITFFFNAQQMTQTIINTIIFCFSKLIPSIFPFMTLSSIFAQYSLTNNNTKKGTLFGIDKRFLKVIIPSWISGFLIGPKLLNKKEVTEDLTDYVIITSNAGIGFVVSFVGIALWKNIYFGIFLYTIQITIAVVLFNVYKCQNTHTFNSFKTQMPLLTTITDSINQSTKTMLDLCGFTIFFSVIKSSLCYIFKINTQSFLCTLISSVLEISNGVFASSTLSNSLFSGFFTGFCIGFGGLCIFTQTISAYNGKINSRKFFKIKLIQGIICGILSSLYVNIFKLSSINSVQAILIVDSNYLSIVISSLYVFLLLIYTKRLILKQI